MAFVNAQTTLTSTSATIYTVPSGKTARIIHCQVAGLHSPSAPLTLKWTDSSATETVTLCDEIPIPANTALAPIAGELVLESGDSIAANTDGTDRLDLSLSVEVE